MRTIEVGFGGEHVLVRSRKYQAEDVEIEDGDLILRIDGDIVLSVAAGSWNFCFDHTNGRMG